MKQDYWTYNKPLSMTGFGGGATSLSNAGASLFSYDDAAYSNFFNNGGNDTPINISNSSYHQVTSFASGYRNHGGLSPFYDHDQGKVFSGANQYSSYNDLLSMPWPEAGNTYIGYPSFYQVQSSVTVLSTALSSFGTGRGCTVAYLQDDTAVFVRTMTQNVNYLHFHYYPSGTYIGYLKMHEASSSGQNDPSNLGNQNDICFDGTHILLLDSNNSGYVFGYDMPANVAAINSSSTIYTSRRWTSSYGGHMIFGMVWTGDGIIYNHYGNGSAKYDRLSGTGYSGTHTYVRNYEHYNNRTDNFGVAMDYKNKILILGGWSNTEMRLYSE